MGYIANRLKEPSTWAGLAMLLQYGAQAVATRDPQAIGAAVAALVAVAAPEARKP